MIAVTTRQCHSECNHCHVAALRRPRHEYGDHVTNMPATSQTWRSCHTSSTASFRSSSSLCPASSSATADGRSFRRGAIDVSGVALFGDSSCTCTGLRRIRFAFAMPMGCRGWKGDGLWLEIPVFPMEVFVKMPRLGEMKACASGSDVASAKKETRDKVRWTRGGSMLIICFR